MAKSSEEFWEDFWDAKKENTSLTDSNAKRETNNDINGVDEDLEDPHIRKLRRK